MFSVSWVWKFAATSHTGQWVYSSHFCLSKNNCSKSSFSVLFSLLKYFDLLFLILGHLFNLNISHPVLFAIQRLPSKFGDKWAFSLTLTFIFKVIQHANLPAKWLITAVCVFVFQKRRHKRLSQSTNQLKPLVRTKYKQGSVQEACEEADQLLEMLPESRISKLVFKFEPRTGFSSNGRIVIKFNCGQGRGY